MHRHLKAIFLAETAFEAGPSEYTKQGRIDEELLTELDLEAASFFLCGPLGFLDEVEGILKHAGIPESRIHIEAFAARSKNTTQLAIDAAGAEYTVTFNKSGVSVRWTADQGTLLDLAEANGLRPPFACRAGTCQSCTTTILSGSVDYLELVDPLSPEETFICCTIPISDVVLDL